MGFFFFQFFFSIVAQHRIDLQNFSRNKTSHRLVLLWLDPLINLSFVPLVYPFIWLHMEVYYHEYVTQHVTGFSRLPRRFFITSQLDIFVFHVNIFDFSLSKLRTKQTWLIWFPISFNPYLRKNELFHTCSFGRLASSLLVFMFRNITICCYNT